jgi:hypothetical protein
VRIGPLLGRSRPSAAALVGLADLDRVDVRPAPRILRRLWRKPVSAMTVMDRVYLDPLLLGADRETLARLLLHELVHVRQWRDAGPRRFLVRYVGDYLRAMLAGRNHDEAYRGIRYEVEARRIAGS